MTDQQSDRIGDLINRLEKIADKFDERCDKIGTHLEAHAARITVLETKESIREKPSKWGTWSQLGSALIAGIALIAALWRRF